VKILLITQDFPPVQGGIQTYLYQLVQQFVKHGHQVKVICPGNRNEPADSGYDFELKRIPIHSSWLFIPLIFYLPFYIPKSEFTHILYAQWQVAIWQLFWPQRARTIPSFCPVYGRELLSSVLGPFTPWFVKKVFRNMHKTFPISKYISKLLQQRTDGDCHPHIVHPGVDVSVFKPMNADYLRERYALNRNPVILSITRLVSRKNIDKLISIMPAIVKEVCDAKLVIGGTGPELENLKVLTARLGLKDKVVFIGRIPEDELVPHYSMADVFVLPSGSSAKDIEGFGIVFLEAGACEVPVIANRTGGIPDAVENGKSGVLVPEGDLNKLGKAIIAQLNSPDLRKKMGSYARARIINGYTWEHTAEKMLQLMMNS
jgi:phosphatidylinositol alpha-1,6-mannosyltransferase